MPMPDDVDSPDAFEFDGTEAFLDLLGPDDRDGS
jgi:hypothetical protein